MGATMTEDSGSVTDEQVEGQLTRLSSAVTKGDAGEAKQASLVLKEKGVPPMDVVNRAIKPAMDEIGRQYDRLEIFLPELVLSGEAAQEALKILLTKEGRDAISKGKVVIGTISGDIHDIGKNIAAAILSANGFQVIDIGNDASPDKFVDTAKIENADIIGMSCLLSPSMYFMRDVMRRLNDEGIRDRFKVIVGGAAVYPDWAREIGADGWAKDAERAVQLCEMLSDGKAYERPLIIGDWR